MRSAIIHRRGRCWSSVQMPHAMATVGSGCWLGATHDTLLLHVKLYLGDSRETPLNNFLLRPFRQNSSLWNDWLTGKLLMSDMFSVTTYCSRISTFQSSTFKEIKSRTVMMGCTTGTQERVSLSGRVGIQGTSDSLEVRHECIFCLNPMANNGLAAIMLFHPYNGVSSEVSLRGELYL